MIRIRTCGEFSMYVQVDDSMRWGYSWFTWVPEKDAGTKQARCQIQKPKFFHLYLRVRAGHQSRQPSGHRWSFHGPLGCRGRRRTDHVRCVCPSLPLSSSLNPWLFSFSALLLPALVDGFLGHDLHQLLPDDRFDILESILHQVLLQVQVLDRGRRPVHPGTPWPLGSDLRVRVVEEVGGGLEGICVPSGQRVVFQDRGGRGAAGRRRERSRVIGG